MDRDVGKIEHTNRRENLVYSTKPNSRSFASGSGAIHKRQQQQKNKVKSMTAIYSWIKIRHRQVLSGLLIRQSLVEACN